MTFERTQEGRPVWISIHMPHTWHDVAEILYPTARSAFQSTCHIRGMTVDFAAFCQRQSDFNPHATYVA